MQSATDILKHYWHYSSFRGEQENIVRSTLEGKDVLAMLPTGGGKSVCFQVPALMSEGLCLAVTPLIALMKDQVENLLAKNIPAFAVHSGLSGEEVRQALRDAAAGRFKFLYLSPERLDTELFRDICEHLNVNLIAVDEAHCISQWGYDFRPAYLQIAAIRKYFPDAPVTALTASATPAVEKDIVEKLLLKNYEVFHGSFQRDNLVFEARHCDNKFNALAEILSLQGESAVVYCKSRRITQEISRLLNMKDISADYYHAGLSQEVRNEKQDKWMNDKLRVMVCTNAFGMGIDKPNVRCVVHYDAPDCLENYYQEAGRAGRDGKMAKAVLLYVRQDTEELALLKEVRFPSFADIQHVYQNICDYLQIPVGIGEGNFYDFDFNTFIRNFKWSAVPAINAIKALEQAGFMSFSENIFLPSKVGFTIDREDLHDFERSYTEYEDIIKCLLRGYEGIVSYRVSVFEKQLAKWMRVPETEVIRQLQALRAMRVIEYLPKKETPQLFFPVNRAPAGFLHFDHAAYLKRKKIFSDRVDKMLAYIRTDRCRSIFIAEYFGDGAAQPCGICDNCKRKKADDLSSEDVEIISSQIFEMLKQHARIDMKELSAKLHHISVGKIKQTVRFLQREERIKTDATGNIYKY